MSKRVHPFRDRVAMLRLDLASARMAAAAAIEGVDDGGTCNFDSLFLPVGRRGDFARKSASLKEATGGWFHSGVYRRGYVISVGGGQGVTRTLAAETAERVMRERGWIVSVWYQVD